MNASLVFASCFIFVACASPADFGSAAEQTFMPPGDPVPSTGVQPSPAQLADSKRLGHGRPMFVVLDASSSTPDAGGAVPSVDGGTAPWRLPPGKSGASASATFTCTSTMTTRVYLSPGPGTGARTDTGTARVTGVPRGRGRSRIFVGTHRVSFPLNQLSAGGRSQRSRVQPELLFGRDAPGDHVVSSIPSQFRGRSLAPRGRRRLRTSHRDIDGKADRRPYLREHLTGLLLPRPTGAASG